MVKQLHTARKIVFYLVGWLEFVISLLVLAGIVVHLAGWTGFWGFFRVENLGDYLKYLFDALIAIELIKLLCRNDLYSMVEVLLFAVALLFRGHQEADSPLRKGSPDSVPAERKDFFCCPSIQRSHRTSE